MVVSKSWQWRCGIGDGLQTLLSRFDSYFCSLEFLFPQKLKTLRLSWNFKRQKRHVGKGKSKCLVRATGREMFVWSMEMSANLSNMSCFSLIPAWKMLCVYVLLSVVVTWIRRTELMKQINEDCQNKLELSKFVSHVFTTYSSKRGVFHEKWNLVTLCSFMWSFLCVEKLFTISFHNWDIITVASGRTNINVNCVMVSVKKWESLLCNIRIDIVYMKVVRVFPCNHLHFLHHPHLLKNPWRF